MAGRPDVRFVYKNKSSNISYELGVAWINEKGFLNLKLVEQSDTKSQYPKLTLTDAVKMMNGGADYFLSIFPIGRDCKIVINDPSASIEDDFGATDDIPF